MYQRSFLWLRPLDGRHAIIVPDALPSAIGDIAICFL